MIMAIFISTTSTFLIAFTNRDVATNTIRFKFQSKDTVTLTLSLPDNVHFHFD